VTAQFDILIQLEQTVLLEELQEDCNQVPLLQVEQVVQDVAPFELLNEFGGHILQLLIPAEFWNVPGEQDEQEPEPLLDENVPGEQAEQPQFTTFDTPTFGFELYI